MERSFARVRRTLVFGLLPFLSGSPGVAQVDATPDEAQRLAKKFLGFLNKGISYSSSEVSSLGNLYDNQIGQEWRKSLDRNAFRDQMLHLSSTLLTVSEPERRLVQARKFTTFPLGNISGDFLLLAFEASYSAGFFREEIYLQKEQGFSGNQEFGNWKIIGGQLQPGKLMSVGAVAFQARAVAEKLLSIVNSEDDAALQDFYTRSLSDIWRNSISRSEFSRTLLQVSKPLGKLKSNRRLVRAASLDQLPGTDRRGNFIKLAYVAVYSVGVVQEQVVQEEVNLERSSDDSWKVIGAFLRPLPMN
jgi:hypothetical protein